MTPTNYANAALLLLGFVVVAGGVASASRYARKLAWQPRILFALIAGLATVGGLTLMVIVGLSPGYVFWPVLAAVMVLIAVLAHWRGSKRKVLDVVEVDEQPAPQLRRGPRLAAPRAVRREDSQ